MALVQTLEDELGDVLEKAIKHSGLTVEEVSAVAGIEAGRIQDAEDYRYDLTCDELRRIARALGLNEVGFCALGTGRYPLPEVRPVGFSFDVLAMPFGVGVVNAFLARGCADGDCILFDTGASAAELEKIWPSGAPPPAAVFLTHFDRDHIGGLLGLRSKFPKVALYGPGTGPGDVCVIGEGAQVTFGSLRIKAFFTPGHVLEHNSYFVRDLTRPACGVLVAGDVLFAGSVGCGFFSSGALITQARRLLNALPPETVIAPGHGPLTTVGNERRYNPFAA